MASHFHIDGLELRLEDFRLGPLSLELDWKDYLVLLGPTGCGKTTLIKCVAGALPSGPVRIFLNGRDIGALPPNRRGVGYVAQITDLFPHLTVGENVAFGLKYMGLTKEERAFRLAKYLDLFAIDSISGRASNTLSGGESKKVAIARSLIVEPELLLLDEPLAMVDHNERKDIIRVLRMIHSELRITTIHVTHDRHEAWSIAKRCAVMNRGRILETGSVAELFRAPGSRFTAEFLGGANIFRADFVEGGARTSWGSFPLGKAPPSASGWLLLRPERISLVDEGQSHRVSAEVMAVRDFGEYIELEVLVGSSETLTVHSSVREAAGIEVGLEIYLGWPDDAVHVLEDEQ